MRALIALVAAVVLFGAADATPAVSPAPQASATPAPVVTHTPCADMTGTTWEIKSLDGLPEKADRTIGADDASTPRSPRLIFGKGVGTWSRVGGDKVSFGWLCDDKGLTITLSGKPLRMPREAGGFRYAGAPVRRFVPATTGTSTP